MQSVRATPHDIEEVIRNHYSYWTPSSNDVASHVGSGVHAGATFQEQSGRRDVPVFGGTEYGRVTVLKQNNPQIIGRR